MPDVTPEESGTRTKPDASGTRTTPDVSGTRTTPDVSGTRTTPDVSGTRTTPEAIGTRTTPEAATATHHTRLLPQDECDKLALRLQHAVGEFVDGPRDAVEEADRVLEEVAARFTEAVTRRRRTLRASWQASGEDKQQTADTEQLRLALREYRETTERLLRI